ncbi:MAG: hypothetical protein ACI9WU_003339 [Myxococcota bacterium]|jgi:hypothetical protein
MGALILTVTRACNLRCSYCPTVKEGWPSLSIADAKRALTLFVERYGGGDIKLFGGEPLLVPEVVEAVFRMGAELPGIRRIYLSTNGLGLSTEWLERVRDNPKAVLTLSMDGAPDDHRRLRRALDGVPDAYDHIMGLLPELLATPRVVVTQTIAPGTAARAAANFDHLRSLGFKRFNLLPGYYLPWREEQLAELQTGFDGIAATVRAAWTAGDYVYLRNLFTRAATPFFNAGLVVDADRRIHPTNVGLSGSLANLLDRTTVGTLDDPPTPEALAERGAAVNALLQAELPERVWQSTLAVDAQLTGFCRELYPDYVAFRAARRAA